MIVFVGALTALVSTGLPFNVSVFVKAPPFAENTPAIEAFVPFDTLIGPSERLVDPDAFGITPGVKCPTMVFVGAEAVEPGATKTAEKTGPEAAAMKYHTASSDAFKTDVVFILILSFSFSVSRQTGVCYIGYFKSFPNVAPVKTAGV